MVPMNCTNLENCDTPPLGKSQRQKTVSKLALLGNLYQIHKETNLIEKRVVALVNIWWQYV